MDVNSLVVTVFSGLSVLVVEDVVDGGDAVVIMARTPDVAVPCPVCGTPTAKVRGYHGRTVTDVPVDGRQAVVHLRVRRQVCPVPGCRRQTFREQIPGLPERHQRRTVRLAGQISQVARELRGRAAARLTGLLAVPVSRSTALRHLRRLPLPQQAVPRVIGVDDFALRRRHRYATIITDAETGRRVAVLPDREAATLEYWLREHGSGVEVVCRDGSATYAEAVRRALPDAVQVSDRWHFWRNLCDKVLLEVRAHAGCWATINPPRPGGVREQTTRERWNKIHDLLGQGVGLLDCSRRLGLALSSTSGAVSVAACPTTFAHPGVLVSRPQLDFVRSKVQAGAEPWKGAYDAMLTKAPSDAPTVPYGSLSRTAKPWAVADCGPVSIPNHGCTDEREDAIAAYTDALAWYISGDDQYAKKSIEIMDAWSGTITGHTNSNAPLQTGWTGSVWPRAAEIIRYTYTPGWSNADRFKTMLRKVYLPEVINGSNSNGNWELSMMEAAVGISVFLDDHASNDKAIARYLNRVPAYIYLSSDGALPKTVPGSGLDTSQKIINYWQGQSTFVSGLTQETCRDLAHTNYGISAISHIAETSWIQKQNLYPQVGERLRQALGFHAKYQLGATGPSWLCGGTLKRSMDPMTEIGCNALHTRLGIPMTNTQLLTEKMRPAGTDNLFIAWETLTDAGNSAGQPATVLTLTTNASSYTRGATATLTAHLGRTAGNRKVSIYAQPAGGTKTLVKAGTVDSSGNLVASYKVTANTDFTVTFGGDYGYAPATATRTVSLKTTTG